MPGYCSLLLVALASSCEAFALARPALHVSTVAPRVSTPATMQLFGKRKTSEEILEEKGYWPGEWVCADCGYIYEPGTTPPFEELRTKWKCPQCAGPRRRFVKKAGGQYGSIDDTPLFLGMGISIAFIAAALFVGLTV